MNAMRNAYGNQLTRSRMEMAAEGYASEPVNGAVPNLAAPQPNGKPGSQPANLDEALNQMAGAPAPAAAAPPKPPGADGTSRAQGHGSGDASTQRRASLANRIAAERNRRASPARPAFE